MYGVRVEPTWGEGWPYLISSCSNCQIATYCQIASGNICSNWQFPQGQGCVHWMVPWFIRIPIRMVFFDTSVKLREFCMMSQVLVLLNPNRIKEQIITYRKKMPKYKTMEILRPNDKEAHIA